MTDTPKVELIDPISAEGPEPIPPIKNKGGRPRKYPVGQEPYNRRNKAVKMNGYDYKIAKGWATQKVEELLPHLNARKRYQWQRNYFESRNKLCFVTAANQAGKSAINIDKCIHWATEKTLWPTLWRHAPRQFWYLYPDLATIDLEYNSKWIPDHLPKGRYKNDKIYGWEEIKDRGKVCGIKFNSGVIVWFKTYSQKSSAMMASTVYAIFTDEELPLQHLPELQARLNYSDGYFHMAFTATLNQEYFYRVMECKGERELLPQAFKQTISLYDCLLYEDGSPSDWTEQRIEEIKQRCSSEMEILRRVYGRFVNEEGVKYSAFDAGRHFVKPFPIPPDFSVYVGIDPGSGGSKNHPASIAFIAVTPDHRRGYVYKGWRGDNVETTSSDIMDQFLKMRGSDKITMQVYDWASREFALIAQRIGEPFNRAEKSHSLGEETLNTLLKNDALLIFDLPELQALGTELATVRHKTSKQYAKDDYIDAVRYAAVVVPWDWSGLILKNVDDKPGKELMTDPKYMTHQELLDYEIKQRRGEVDKEKEDGSWREFDDECSFWNEQYGNE